MCPLIASVSAGVAPLYGTCTMLMRAMVFSSSIERWGEAPTPEEPKLIWPGRALASAMNSRSVLTGIEGCTMKTLVTAPIIEGNAKSRM